MAALPQSFAVPADAEHLNTLSLLALAPRRAAEAVACIAALDEEERASLLSLADSHHVTLRALGRFLMAAGAQHPLARWAVDVLAAERERIGCALRHLHNLVCEMEAHGLPVVVIKSLDHVPDLGNDLDLYTTAAPEAVVDFMSRRFAAQLDPRSWGDRLANKWNFRIPGLRESVEVHVQRLGQTGEHTELARRFVTRRVQKRVGEYSFPVPAPEERVIVAALQRMYRHFYFRICDVVNTAELLEASAANLSAAREQKSGGVLNFVELERASRAGGIWPGVATYLKLVADYAARYRGTSAPLPENVRSAARFGGEKLSVRARFIRVPMLPEAAALYTRQVRSTALRGDVPATFRLSLLPPLASAAAIAYRLTGDDKGIW
jgi:hypothetical protein